MKNYMRYFVLALLVGGIGISDKLFAADGPVVGDGQKTWGQTYEKWRIPAFTGVAIPAAYLGARKVAEYVPSEYMWVGAVAGLGVAGARYIPGLYRSTKAKVKKIYQSAEGLRTVANEMNDLARDGGLKNVMKTYGKATFEGMSEAFTEKAIDPTIKKVGTKIKPWGESVSKAFGKVETAVKGFAWKTLAVGVGIIAAGYGLYRAHKYYEKHINKPRLDVVVKKAELNGIMPGSKIRRVIAPEETRKRLDKYLLYNLRIKRANSPENPANGSSYYDGFDDMQEAYYSNLALIGPHGSGKRMFAQEMAQCARMDYYEVPWSSFNKFKEGEAAQAIELFFKEGVMKSKNGAVIYIDNAQMIFNNSGAEGVTSANATSIINALVAATENRSSKYLVIFGMPMRSRFDRGMLLIVDDVLEIPLPELGERKKLLRQYRDLYFTDKSYALSEKTEQAVETLLNDQELDKIAQRIDKASAAEFAGFMKTLKIESELPASEGLTPGLIKHLIKCSEQRYDHLTSAATA